MTRHIFVTLCLSMIGSVTHHAEAQILVPNTSTWSYLHPTDGVDPAEQDEDFHTTFYQLDFDDSQWKKGQDKPGKHGGFGYGDEEFEGVDLGAPEDPNNRKTAYFRLKFKTDADQKNLVFKCQRDDGIIVYLDGKEVLRDNIARGTFGLLKKKDAYDLFAQSTIYVDAETQEDAETKVNSWPLAAELSAGEHILAISLHNRPSGSSDLRIAEISLAVKSDDEEHEADAETAADGHEHEHDPDGHEHEHDDHEHDEGGEEEETTGEDGDAT